VKRLTALAMGVLFLTGIAGVAAAQTTTPPATEKKAEEKKAGGMKKMARKSASGTVKSASADSITVAGKAKGKDAEWTFAVDPKTTIRKAGKAITPADVKAGDSVSVQYMEHDGKPVASNVTVRPAPTAKKTAKKADTKAEAKPAEKK
jgi:hypothetical protein